MKRRLSWLIGNSDAIVALALAVMAAILDAAGQIPVGWINNATLLILAGLGFVMLHDRINREALRTEVRAIPDAIRTSSKVQILSGAEIGRALALARQETDVWLFKGSTATFVRAVTLPECVDAARRNGRSLVVRLEILDPTNLELCEHYSRLYYRLASTPNAPERRWTTRNTQVELYATILAACWYRARYELLEIDISLCSTVTTFRWEMSSDYFIITQQGPRFPATLVERGHLYFDCWATEIRASFQQGRRLLIDRVSSGHLSENPSVDEARGVFELLGIEPSSDFTDEDISQIIRLALHDIDPYGPTLRKIDQR
jgi:hypothetical protein